MSRLTYIIIAIIAIIIIGALVVSSQGNDRASQDQSAEINEPAEIEEPETLADYSIIYTDAGFSPRELSTKQGETVAFVNNSSGELWVASAPHPEHTDYPELDAKEGYMNGESYTFTFNKTGSWRFHNHLNPDNNGVITVSN